MEKTTARAVETWDLGEMLAALCRIAQIAGEEARAGDEVIEKLRIGAGFPASNQAENHP